MPKSVTETTLRWSNCTASLLTAAKLYLNSPLISPKNWGQVNPNVTYYHSNPMQTNTGFWLPDITDWWLQHQELLWKYANPSDVSRIIFSIIQHAVGMGAIFSLGCDVIGWRLSKTTARTLRGKCCSNAVCSSQSRNIDKQLCSIGYHGNW